MSLLPKWMNWMAADVGFDKWPDRCQRITPTRFTLEVVIAGHPESAAGARYITYALHHIWRTRAKGLGANGFIKPSAGGKPIRLQAQLPRAEHLPHPLRGCRWLSSTDMVDAGERERT